MTTHTTKSAAEYLQRRYAFKVQARTVKQWCNRGKLPAAWRIGEGRRATWQIPEESLDYLMATKKSALELMNTERNTKGIVGGDKGGDIPH